MVSMSTSGALSASGLGDEVQFTSFRIADASIGRHSGEKSRAHLDATHIPSELARRIESPDTAVRARDDFGMT